MKDKKQIMDFCSKISSLLDSPDEHSALINLAVNFGLINGQMLQIDFDLNNNLRFNGVTFGEYGVGILIANSLYHNQKKSIH